MATYYIGPAGNDTTGNGSSGNPWLTFSKFNASSASGDTCILLDGTYTWTAANYSIIGNRTYSAENTRLAIMDAGGVQIAHMVCGSVGATVTVNGLVFQNAVNTSDAIFTFYKQSTAICTFNHCTFKDMTTYSSGNLGGMFGLYYDGAAYGGTWNFNYCRLENIQKGVSSGSIFYMRQVPVTVNINNCTFIFNGATQVSYVVGYSIQGYTFTMKNSIMYASSALTFLQGALTSQTTSYNDLYGLTLTNYSLGTGEITSDPLLVDLSSGDFRLRPTSPCIGTGTL